MYSNRKWGSRKEKKEIQHFSINPREINGRLMKGMSAIFANGIEMALEENYQFILALVERLFGSLVRIGLP